MIRQSIQPFLIEPGENPAAAMNNSDPSQYLTHKYRPFCLIAGQQRPARATYPANSSYPKFKICGLTSSKEV
jgi:hypothetical protein